MNTSNKSIKYIILFFTIWQLAACNNKQAIEVSHVFPENVWNRFDLIELEAVIDKIDTNYDLHLHLEHDSAYPFDNLYINVALYLPSGEIRVNEYTFDIKDKNGAFLSQLPQGKGDLSFLLREDFYFSEPGIFKVEIECLIPRVEIKGIQNIGITLKKSKDKK
jgi:gliding motility-associated lipoprotein GldH